MSSEFFGFVGNSYARFSLKNGVLIMQLQDVGVFTNLKTIYKDPNWSARIKQLIEEAAAHYEVTL